MSKSSLFSWKMDQGGDGVERHDFQFITGWMFGSVLIALSVALPVWGTFVPPWIGGCPTAEPC